MCVYSKPEASSLIVRTLDITHCLTSVNILNADVIHISNL